MKKIFLLQCLLLLTASRSSHADLIINATPAAIPDNNALGIQQTITLSGYTAPIASLDVRLTISGQNGGAFNGDYFVTLQHDSGYAVLLNRVGRSASNPFGYSDNGFDVTFTLAASDIHVYQTVGHTFGASGELTGTWGVDGRAVDPLFALDTDARTATLASFNGIDANGTWTLFVADTSLNGEGTLEAWGIDVTVVPEPSTMVLFFLGCMTLAVRRARTARFSC